MSTPQTPTPPAPPPQIVEMPWRQSLASRLRNYLFAGILVTAPISITAYVAWNVVDYIDTLVTGLIPAQYNPNTYLPFAIPGLGIIILIIGLVLVGFLTANFLGRLAGRIAERVVARLPVVRSFYAAIKQIFETVFSRQTQSFREVVLVEFPHKEMWALGLVVGKSAPEVQLKPEELNSVFVPTMSFTSGYLVFVARKDMTTVDISVEEALKMIVSGGIVTPPAKVIIPTEGS